MTRDQLYSFITEGLTDGSLQDSSLLGNLLDTAQMQIEGMRPWVQLRSEDATQTWSPGNTFLSGKTLPADFARFYDTSPVQLLDSANNPMQLVEIPFGKRYAYQTINGRFCVDYKNSLIYIMGVPTQSYTILQQYIYVPTLVSSDANATWVFPERFQRILGFWVAALWRQGVDYDVYNNKLGDQQAMQARAMIDIMTRWDSELQASMQVGVDPTMSTNGFGRPSGGFVQM